MCAGSTTCVLCIHVKLSGLKNKHQTYGDLKLPSQTVEIPCFNMYNADQQKDVFTTYGTYINVTFDGDSRCAN